MPADLIKPWSHDYDDYLSDESRRTGVADSISFPTSEAEVIDAIRASRALGAAITVQGSRTGIVAGAVPEGGLVLNLSRMKQIGDIRVDEQVGEHRVTVQPGVLLSELREAIAGQGLFLPPDPTETTASLGGMVACNASGALSFHYGATRNWVRALEVVLADGSTVSVRRGEWRADGRAFSLATDEDRVIQGSLPSYTPPGVKSAAGYYAVDDMDLLDLFIGAEGTLGVVTEIELALLPRPAAVAGLTLFVPTEAEALKLVRIARGEQVDGLQPPPVKPVAIEFFDSDALDLLRKMKNESAAFAEIPALKPHFHTAINVEFHGGSDDEVEEAVMALMESAMELGASDDDTWFATTDREMEPLKSFRHAVPEAVNLLIGERKRSTPELTKLGTDMSVPDAHLEAVMAMYDEGLSREGLESVKFGHIGNNHVHVNILPNSMEEYDRGKSLYLGWAREVVALGGSVSAEHGIGKIKAPFLEMMYGEAGINQMRSLKALFDPDMALNRGNLFSPELPR